jgi:UDP-N-acetylmuramoylalanine--D-glutamate ligase
VQDDAENAEAAAQGRVRTELGAHRRATFLAAHVLVVSPGAPPTQADVAAAAAAGVRVLSELAFAAQALPPGLPIVAVTGTNGERLEAPLGTHGA